MLVRAGHEVRAFVRSEEAFRQVSSEERIDVVEGDILDRGSVGEALGGAEAVVHCVDFPAHEFNHNWDAARHALEALGSGGYFVLPGDVSVYGASVCERIDPDHPKESPAKLGAVRADLEKAVLAEGGTVIRLPGVYGPGVRSGPLRGVFPRALQGRTIWYPGALDREIEYLYIGDAARALVAPLGQRHAKGVEYTAAGCAATTPREFVGHLSKAVGRPVRLRSLPIALINAVATVQPERRPLRELSYLLEHSILMDGKKIRSELGWIPEVGYVDGIRRTVRWMRGTA
jgi:nucleoside-diphosphate-sugar epimerase